MDRGVAPGKDSEADEENRQPEDDDHEERGRDGASALRELEPARPPEPDGELRRHRLDRALLLVDGRKAIDAVVESLSRRPRAAPSRASRAGRTRPGPWIEAVAACRRPRVRSAARARSSSATSALMWMSSSLWLSYELLADATRSPSTSAAIVPISAVLAFSTSRESASRWCSGTRQRESQERPAVDARKDDGADEPGAHFAAPGVVVASGGGAGRSSSYFDRIVL